MYDTNRVHDLPISPEKLLSSMALACVAVLGLGIPFNAGEVHLWVWYSTWIAASYTLLLLNRMIAHHVLAAIAATGRFDMRIAVFGAGTIARRVADHLADPSQHIAFVGLYDDRGEDRVDAAGLEIRGRLDDLIALGRSGAVDSIIVALPQSADNRIATVTRQLEQVPTSVHVVTHIASDLVETGPAHKVSALGPVGLLDVKPRPLSGWGPTVKALMDYGIGTVLLLLALPVMAVIAVAIKVTSTGPVLFTQRRSGLNRRVINVYKFRTMTVCEDGSDIRQASADDDRITTVGRFLRRLSLDELPQLFNVIKGEMSLVGPRPHALAHDQQWGGEFDRYVNRHQVKPGLTGLAQIEGWRGEAGSVDKIKGRVERDLAYIAGWSPALDLWILYRTMAAVIRGENAH
jgi:putative colanic acid biosynthesis UDP-glucose lipid carrier transferase